MSCSTRTHDVFISFRGEDTRTNFTSHLYSALCRSSIKTYIDNSLKKGVEVWPALYQAIQDSHIAIVVFSQNYASSKWCLEELIKILECRKDKRHRQVVIPVFYEVDPSHIRKQTGSYGEAIAKHEQSLGDRDNEFIQKKVLEWKLALTEAANISGWDSHSREYKDDSQVIDKIVKDVLQKLYWRNPIELEMESVVGIDKVCEYIEFLLSTSKQNQLLKNVKVIGIWGMGGIGKTTIAKVMFARLFPMYDSACFLANIREVSENSRQSKLASLRDKLHSELLKEENPESKYGSTFIMRRLSSKQNFTILDDVDSLDQLDELYREYKYAGPNSKLIITTRNRHLLSGIADEIYEAKVWSFDESLELFSLHAFKQRCPKEGYKELSKTAIDYAGGVPLALKVLGSTLYSRSPDFWGSELKKLKSYPNDRIQNVLQVSYDGLDSLEKKIFLDIAFFFKDEHKDVIIRILDACGFYASSGMQVLEDKALINVSYDKRIQMHDLLEEMGLKIVRQGIEDPGRRSRLRDIREISDVFNNERGSDAVEGIQLDLSHIDDLLSLSADSFNVITYLRFLKLYIPSDKRSGRVDYPKVLDKISNNLRYLEWHGYRLKYLPTTFCAKMLVEIRMPHSHLIELWRGVQDVVNLEGIDLSECKQLKNLPDLSKASKLKWVNLTGCKSLSSVHPSVLSLNTLETLILDNCKKLKNLKSGNHLRSLKKVNIDGCTSLKEFSVLSDKIEKLDLSKTGIEKLHSSVGNMTRLRELNLEGLRLRNLPNELCFLKSLWDLRISNWALVMDKQKLHVLFDGLRRLVILHLKDCCNLFELPDNISSLYDLRELILDGSSVEKLPESIKHLEYLDTLFLNNCSKFKCVPALPLDIKVFSVTKRTLLMDTVILTRKREKYILFENCMKLDEPSLNCIIQGIQLTMMCTFLQNKYADTRMHFQDQYFFNYSLVNVCLAGSRVPRQFTYRTIENKFCITIPSAERLLGIIMCAVLSPSPKLKEHGPRIWCQCYLEKHINVGRESTCSHTAIKELNSDHVYLWCHSFDFESIFKGHKSKLVCFEFFVTNDKEEKPEVLNIRTKECGVHVVHKSADFSRILRGLYSELGAEFDFDVGWDESSDLNLDLESIYRETSAAVETSNAKECNDRNNQERDLSDNCSCSCDCLFDVLRYLWRLIMT